MRSAAGQTEAARQAWQESLARTPSPWVLRNLAVLERQEGRAQESADLYLRAARMAPELAPLAVECLAALLQAGRDRQVLDLVAQLPPAVAALGRVRLIQARAAVGAGDLELAQRLLGGLEVSDIREGDNVITETWFLLHERRLAAAEGVPIDEALKERVRRDFPPPPHLDFRMFRARPAKAPQR
jgi:tetratricopeptide (TPR) repeat protein